jgi:hypothetical protein
VVSALLAGRAVAPISEADATGFGRRRREKGTLNWIRGLSETKQGLVVTVTLGLIVLGFALLMNLIA